MHVTGIHVNIELNKLLGTPAFKASENADCSRSFHDISAIVLFELGEM